MLDPNLKQRLIGAAVLIGVGVVVIPLLLQGPVEPSRRESGGVEKSGSGETTAASLPMSGKGKGRREAAALTVSAPPSEASVVTQPAPSAKTAGKRNTGPAKATAVEEKGGWLVQIGSFTQPENAQRRRDEAVAAGYKAFIEPGKKGAKTIYRVRIGPEREAGQAKRLKKELEQRLRVNAFLISPPAG